MSANQKGTVISIIGGALLGAIFMLALLGYLHIGKVGPAANVSPVTSLQQSDFTNRSINLVGSRDSATQNIDFSRRNAIVQASENVGPAVVSLSVTQVLPARSVSPYASDFWDYFFPPRGRQVLSLGSGVIINSKGYVLTNDHVVDGAQEIRVTLENGDEYPGRLVGADPVTDLAVVKIMSDTSNFKNAILGNSDDLITGEWAIAIGNPFGYLLDDPHPTVTVGVISATNRDIKPETGQKAVYRKMIQTDAAINPGNSGGPLVNALGEVIGINTFIFTSSRGSEGIGFAIPINRAKIVIDDILKYGEVVKAWIGINVQSITPAMAASMKLNKNKGLVISSISADSPASRAGLKSGDLLLSVGKLAMSNRGDWDEIVNYARAGKALPIAVIRDSRKISLVVVPEEIPTRLAKHRVDKYGLDVAEITPAIASYLGLNDRNGVIVLGSEPKDQAYNWDLQENDIIRGVGNIEISSIDNYISVISKIGHGYRVVFTVERDGRVFLVPIFT